MLKANGIERVRFALEREHIEAVIKERSVDLKYVGRMADDKLLEPAIGLMREDGTTLTVDGHHRMVRWYGMGLNEGIMFLFKVGQEDPFRLELPAHVHGQLYDELSQARHVQR